MSFDVSHSVIVDLVRSSIRQLQPYSSARGLVPSEGARQRVYLDANEWGGDGEKSSFNRYPDPQPAGLLEAYSQFLGVKPEQLLVGRGADEAIDILVRTFCDAERDAIIVTPPSYGFYGVAASIQGVRIIPVPLIGRNFDLDEAGILSAINRESMSSNASKGRVKLVFICSPNNPTGNAFDRERLLVLARNLRGKAILVVDEAYIEFTGLASLALDTADYPNLVVLRTMSKALAHAGARVGAAVASPELIAWLQKVRAPYPLSQLQVDTALHALKQCRPDELKARREFIAGERQRLTQYLLRSNHVQEVWPSVANFLLVRLESHRKIIDEMRERGILIRDRSSEFGLKNCVRITLGNRRENDEFMAAFDTLEKQS